MFKWLVANTHHRLGFHHAWPTGLALMSAGRLGYGGPRTGRRTIRAMLIERTTRLAGIVTVLLLAGCTAAPLSSPDASSPDEAAIPTRESTRPATPEPIATEVPSAPSTPTATIPDRTVEESGGFRLARLTSASCTAEAPADWFMTAPDNSDRADVLSPDGTRYAGYGIQAVNTTLQGFAPAYQPPLDDPELYSKDTATTAAAFGRIIVAGIGGAGDLVVEEAFQISDEYLLLSVVGSTHRGGIFFRANGFPGDGYNYTYALPMYFAFTTLDQWDGQGLLTARVAASIRCSTQFQPPDDYFTVEAGDTGAGSDPNGADDGYNPQLGTEYASDPNTGENYLVDPSVNWSDSGPDGPGYYVPKGGGDYQRLQPGRID